jgi:tetratricopeptide (TPR) repeat protein
VSARTRVIAVTVAVAALAAAGAIAVATFQGERAGEITAPQTQALPDGPPPLTFDLGLRADAEARELRRAADLYAGGRSTAARDLFVTGSSLEARVGAAVAAWPDGTLDRLSRLAGLHPRSAVVQLHLGIAQAWSGVGDPRVSWQAAAEAEPDTAYAVVAGNLLHPRFARGMPLFLPTAPLPAKLDRLEPEAQLELLRQRAALTVDGKLLYGTALQRLARPVSARKMFAAAARQAPEDVEARVADAVGRFDKGRPAEAFSRLGPLTRRFPDKATVRFHLGLLLLWSGEVRAAKRQLSLARTAEPGSPLAREARRYLDELKSAGL